MTTTNIDRLAEQLLINHDLLKAPVKISKLAKSLGIRVEMQDLDDEVSGFLVRKNNQDIVGVNINHPENRQRFTISHEIGHYMLHINQQSLFVDYYKGDKLFRKNSTRENYLMERQANQFAASLLMPKKLIAEEILKLPEVLDYEVKKCQISLKFKVSEQAMDFRLKALGYYDYGF
ncbi:ImmA/IrrE family metallo-endopeptidase [Maribacter sp. LLG6340-A2]|uniref:ImmA/IrrE family metallo-endopeptidase n=1 Tax=Maribacter sp. LLG6340-A2 TaxID=3160834 RepID=UPI00386A4D3D